MRLTKKPAKIFITLLMFIGFMLFFAGNALAAGDESYWGYNTEQDNWTHGNLGKDYLEGDWVSYQLVISKDSKVWGAENFQISWNFHQDSSDAIYIDGFKNFQMGTTLLPDGTQEPPGGWGTSLSVGAGIYNYQEPWPVGTSETAEDPADERYFTVDGSYINWTGDQVVLFYQAHLALTIIWSNGLETYLPSVLDGDAFEGWEAHHPGSSAATGSSRHFYLQYEGIGQKDVPIPITEYPEGKIYGFKYVGVPDSWIEFDGWEVDLEGSIPLDSLGTILYFPPTVLTGDGDWDPGYYEFTGLVAGDYTVIEELRAPYTPFEIVVSGFVDPQPYDITDLSASFLYEAGQEVQVDFYNTLVGCLRIVKEVDLNDVVGTVPDVDFVITVTGPSYPTGTDLTFNLVNGVISGAQDLSNLLPGSYTVEETPPAGWTLDSIVTSPVDVTGGAACGDIVVTVDNTLETGCLEVQKVVQNQATAPDASFTITVEGPSYPIGTDLVFNLAGGVITGPDDGDTACLCDLIPGAYTVSETSVPVGWEAPVLDPLDGVVTVDAGDECDVDAKLVTVTNTPSPPVCRTACAAQGDPLTNAFPDASKWFTYIVYNKGDGTEAAPREYPIFTGQTHLCGTLYVWDVGDELHVKFTVLDGSKWIGFSEYHLQVDDLKRDLFNAILNKSGNPVPGRCEYADGVDFVDEMEITADISGYTNDRIWIFAHSLVCK